MISQVLSGIFGLGVVVVLCLQFISKRVIAFWSLSRKYNKNAFRAGIRAVNFYSISSSFNLYLPLVLFYHNPTYYTLPIAMEIFSRYNVCSTLLTLSHRREQRKQRRASIDTEVGTNYAFKHYP